MRYSFGPGIRPLGIAFIVAGLGIGCASDSLTLPEEGKPAFVTIVNGNGQQGMAGSMLGDTLVVRITDSESRPVVSRNIAFQVSSGSVQPSTVMTNGEGKAVFRWVLGPTAGEQTLEAGLGSTSQLSPKVTFVATALAGPVATIASMSGDGQMAPVGTPLPQPLVVQLKDSFGNAVAGAIVLWQASNGTLSQRSVATGEDGRASVIWTLGTAPGTQSVTATFSGADGSPTRFTATALAGASPRLAVVVQPAGNTQSGVELSRQPSIRLETAQGTAITQSGVSITAAIASGGGTLSGTTTVTTNASGVANFDDLVITGSNGSRTLIFAAANYTPAVSAPVVVASPGPSAQYSTAHVPGGRILRWTTIRITTRDNSGNDLDRGGYASLIKVSVAGANTNSSLTIFDQGNGDYTASYFPVFKGNDTITITIGGVPIKGSPFHSKVK
jgi:hypothetical protein